MAGNTQLQLEAGDNKDVSFFSSQFTDPWISLCSPAAMGPEGMGMWATEKGGEGKDPPGSLALG